MADEGRWMCSACGLTDDIALYCEELRKPGFMIAPVLPTCNCCGREVRPVSAATRCRNRVFVVTGPMGSGKTSTAETLYSKHGFNAIDHDCTIDLVCYKHDSEVEFNGSEVVSAIETSLDALLAFEKDVVMSLMILPSELDTYRTMLRKRGLNYTVFFLCPNYRTVLERTKSRTCFGSVTPEKWVRHFYTETEAFRRNADNDVVLLDNTDLTVIASTKLILDQFR